MKDYASTHSARLASTIHARATLVITDLGARLAQALRASANLIPYSVPR